jgi:hypothetical protein
VLTLLVILIAVVVLAVGGYASTVNLAALLRSHSHEF